MNIVSGISYVCTLPDRGKYLSGAAFNDKAIFCYERGSFLINKDGSYEELEPFAVDKITQYTQYAQYKQSNWFFVPSNKPAKV